MGETEGDVIDWKYPNSTETSSEFCRRMGWGIGTVLLYSGEADARGVPQNPRRWTIERLDISDGTLPGADFVEMSGPYKSGTNMISSGLRVADEDAYGSITWRTVCWPWAEAEPTQDCKRKSKSKRRAK